MAHSHVQCPQLSEYHVFPSTVLSLKVEKLLPRPGVGMYSLIQDVFPQFYTAPWLGFCGPANLVHIEWFEL